MSITLISGSYPPDICGVGDYSFCLMNNTNRHKWNLFYTSKWGIRFIKSIIKGINKTNPQTIILQYPTEGYGWSLTPQLLSIYYSLFTKKKFIVTLHEFANRTAKAKLATLLFLFSNKIIFTSSFEKEAALKLFPKLNTKIRVINIISNINPPTIMKSWDERNLDLVYFGHLRPNKGLEDFFYVADKLKSTQIKIGIIGQVLNQYENYFEDIKKQFPNLNISFFFNKKSNEVTEILNNSKICFLPFPDGLSERRGSFLAAISCGTYVISYNGPYITSPLKQIAKIVDIDSAKGTILHVKENMNNEIHKEYMTKCSSYLQENIPKDWTEIVNKYESIADERKKCID